MMPVGICHQSISWSDFALTFTPFDYLIEHLFALDKIVSFVYLSEVQTAGDKYTIHNIKRIVYYYK